MLDDNEKQTVITLIIEYSKTIGVSDMCLMNHLHGIIEKLSESDNAEG